MTNSKGGGAATARLSLTSPEELPGIKEAGGDDDNNDDNGG